MYRVLEFTGTFDHTKEVLIGMRQSPDAKREYVNTGRNASSDKGYFIVTPLVTTTGHVFWVNRGWVPRNMQEQSKRPLVLLVHFFHSL